MSDDFDLIAEIREDNGKGASRRLRREGKVPAILYGAGRDPRNLAFDHNKVLRQLENESFYSSVLNIKVGDKTQPAILKDIQRHPAKLLILHMDFQRIVDDEEIRMNVPLHFLGEDEAPGAKLSGGTISHLINDVEVVCLPKHLPEYLEIDVSEVKLDETLHLSDIKLPEGVTIPELEQGPDHDQIVLSIQEIKAAPIEDEDDAGEAEDAADDGAEASAEKDKDED